MLPDGSVICATNQVAISSDDTYDDASIVVLGQVDTADIGVNYIDFDNNDLGKEQLPFTFEVQNNSAEVINSIDVRLEDSHGTIITKQMDVNLAAFSCETYTITYDVSKEDDTTIILSVFPTNKTDRQTENNTVTTTIENTYIYYLMFFNRRDGELYTACDSKNISVPEGPQEAHYNFIGWSEDGKTLYDFDQPVTHNITPVPLYKGEDVTMTFGPNNGNGTWTQIVCYGDTIVLSEGTPQNENGAAFKAGIMKKALYTMTLPLPRR